MTFCIPAWVVMLKEKRTRGKKKNKQHNKKTQQNDIEAASDGFVIP